MGIVKNNNPRIEWMCRNCGNKNIKHKRDGRPMPGRCPRKSNGGPHSWVKNREWS